MEAHAAGLRELEQVASIDPRPDLVEDHALWETVLTEAHAMTHADTATNHRVYHLLRGVRCLGARLSLDDKALRVERSTEIPEAEWTDIRQRYLMPLREELTAFLTSCYVLINEGR